ncbi:MAG: hypothetical protein KDK37_01975 [Leptospiraceae bacterium]|nr:hypothetical protein [Leptospiraceae bacterium]MCB1303010.1 hypothetical protein [Leptospiraceae bacterium]
MSARIVIAISAFLFAGALLAEGSDKPCSANLNSSIAAEQIAGAKCAAEKGADDYSAELISLVSSNSPDEVRLEAAYALSTLKDDSRKDQAVSSLLEVAKNSKSVVMQYAAALTLHVLVEKGDDRGAEVTALMSDLSDSRDELLADLTTKLASARSK